MNMNILKKELVDIYKNYLINSDEKEMKKKAGEIYNKYKDLDPVLKPEISIAIINLVDIAFETGVDLSKEQAELILLKLQNSSKS